MSEFGKGVHKYESTLRYLSPKNRHFVLLAAKVHRTVCFSAHDPLSKRGLAIAPLKFLTLYDVIMLHYMPHYNNLQR